MSAPRVVLFDLDDTLFDHSYSAHRTLESVVFESPALSKEPFEDLKSAYRDFLEETHVAVLAERMTLEHARAERFRLLFSACGADISWDEAVASAERGREAYQGSRRVVTGTHELLRALKRQSVIGIVTNNVTVEQEDKLRACRLDGLVDFLVTSEDVGATKPDPHIFEVALERAGCQAEEAVMVGDSWNADVLGAVGAGVRAVWFNRRGANCPEPLLAQEIQSFEPKENVVKAISGRAAE